jgi:hypothetical protein
VSVGVLLFFGWFSIPLPMPHLVLGSAFAAIVGLHIATRPRLLTGVIRARSRAPRGARTRKRLAADVVLALATVATTVTGFVQWAGIAPGPANGLHAMTSAVLFGFAIRHVWTRRRRLRQRFSGPQS